MLKVPKILLAKYHTLLVGNHIPSEVHDFYKKWLRFYLDFCKKYKYPYSDPESLNLYIKVE